MTDGWIQHDGGECPVDRSVVVEVARLGSGMRPVGSARPAGLFRWKALGGGYKHITAYRPVIPQDDAHAAVALLARLLEAGGANGNASVRDWIKAEDEARALLNKIRGEG